MKFTFRIDVASSKMSWQYRKFFFDATLVAGDDLDKPNCRAKLNAKLERFESKLTLNGGECDVEKTLAGPLLTVYSVKVAYKFFHS